MSEDAVEDALDKISLIALKGVLDKCPGCGRKQGYIFDAGDVRDVLVKLVKKVTK